MIKTFMDLFKTSPEEEPPVEADLEYRYFQEYVRKYNLLISPRRIVNESLFLINQSRSLLLDRVYYVVEEKIAEKERVSAYKDIFTDPYDQLVLYELNEERYWRYFADEDILKQFGNLDEVREKIIEMI